MYRKILRDKLVISNVKIVTNRENLYSLYVYVLLEIFVYVVHLYLKLVNSIINTMYIQYKIDILTCLLN